MTPQDTDRGESPRVPVGTDSDGRATTPPALDRPSLTLPPRCEARTYPSRFYNVRCGRDADHTGPHRGVDSYGDTYVWAVAPND